MLAVRLFVCGDIWLCYGWLVVLIIVLFCCFLFVNLLTLRLWIYLLFCLCYLMLFEFGVGLFLCMLELLVCGGWSCFYYLVVYLGLWVRVSFLACGVWTVLTVRFCWLSVVDLAFG